MALERDPWSTATYNGFAKTAATAAAAAAPPVARRPRRPPQRSRRGAAVAAMALLAGVAAATVFALPVLGRLWSGVPVEAALPSVFDEAQVAQPAASAPPPILDPKPVAPVASAPATAVEPAPAARAPRDSDRPKPRHRIDRPRAQLAVVEARRRGAAATAAANLEAAVAPDSTLSSQAADLPPQP